jgi:hypothetical protein
MILFEKIQLIRDEKVKLAAHFFSSFFSSSFFSSSFFSSSLGSSYCYSCWSLESSELLEKTALPISMDEFYARSRAS